VNPYKHDAIDVPANTPSGIEQSVSYGCLANICMQRFC